jgi:hypothetical protein
LREFPQLVQLHHKYRDRIACVSVNVDFSGLPDQPPESLKEQVLAVLKKQRVTFVNFLSSTPDLQLYAELDLTSVPAVLILGADGRLIRRLDNGTGEFGTEGFSYRQHVEPLLEQLLRDG